ncbi:MAG TPA: hypothetical protein VJ949_02070 [Cryomorphaceae bacterium]|nr:hypothetical protein [Cryomorphaceae bacterium]
MLFAEAIGKTAPEFHADVEDFRSGGWTPSRDQSEQDTLIGRAPSSPVVRL